MSNESPIEKECPYECLEAEIWRMLLGRAAIFRAVRTRLGELEDAARDLRRQGRSIRTALDCLYAIIEDVASNSTDDLQAVADIVTTWQEELSEIALRKATIPNGKQLLNDLCSLVVDAVASDPFREIFKKVEAQASVIYNVYWRETSLSLGHVREHPRPLNHDPYALTAVTTIFDRKAAIELHIYPPEFGPAAYAALPFVLIHECVCHVGARQDKNDNHSTFAEGFMDWAATYFFEQWMSHIDIDLEPAARQHGAHLGEVLKGDANPAWAQRRYGHRQAILLASWFQKEIPCSREEIPPSAEEVRAKVAHLAVELNRTDAPLVTKDRFVSRLSRLSSPSSAELRRGLLAWGSGDAPALELLGRA